MNSYDKILSYENEIYKQLHEESKQRRNQIESKIVPTITLLTAETSAIIWSIYKFIQNIIVSTINLLIHHIIFGYSICVSIATYLVTVSIFVSFLIQYDFFYINPSKLSMLIDENKKFLNLYTEDEILYNIKENAVAGYKKICIENWHKINQSIEKLNMCYRFVVITLVFLMINFICALV